MLVEPFPRFHTATRYKDESNYTKGPFSTATIWVCTCGRWWAQLLCTGSPAAEGGGHHYLQPCNRNCQYHCLQHLHHFYYCHHHFLKIIINSILILNPSQVDKNFHLIFHIFNLLEASWTSTSAPKRISSLGTALKKLTWTTVGGLWASLVFFLKEAKPLERSEKLLEEWRGARFRTL